MVTSFSYCPYPGGGEKWGGNGVGDDLYSYGFDGVYLWTGTFILYNVTCQEINLQFYEARTTAKLLYKAYTEDETGPRGRGIIIYINGYNGGWYKGVTL